MCCMEPGKSTLSNEEIGRGYSKTSGNHINLYYHFISELQIVFLVFILGVQCIYSNKKNILLCYHGFALFSYES